MREIPLSSKIVLILAGPSDITSTLSHSLQKEVSKVYRASIPHEAMVRAILAEPDFILIEVTPSDVSGLQFPEMLRQIKGMKKAPFFFIYADKKAQGSFQKKIEPVYFLDQEKIPALIAMMKTGDGPALKMEERAPRSVYAIQGVKKRERVESPLMPRISRRESKELDVLEKLGQLGIIKKT
ncbi:MAG: hypothetical protein HY202_06330 [Nitrospirae bacterium]|nr:hypothetical protein [Nitrospirota bacterium]